MVDLQRRDALSPTSRATVLNIVSWVLLTLVIFTLIARCAVKLSRRKNRRTLALDDVFLCLAALFSFGQTVAVSIQWRDGVGQQASPSSVGPKDVYEKAAYASNILFIANMGCAKISISFVIRKLFTGRLFEYTSVTLALFTAAWTTSGVLVTAFQCRLPTPWRVAETDHCIDVAAFGNFLASTNVVTEVLLVLVPLAVWARGTAVGNRRYVTAAFISRLSIIAAVVAQMYFFNISVPASSINSSWNTTLCMQIAQTLSVVSACLPGLHPLVAKDMSENSSPHSPQPDNTTHWDTKKFGSLSSHSSQPSIDSHTALEPVISPYCRSLLTHGLVRSSPSCDSYSIPRMPSATEPTQPTLYAPENVFNRLVGVSAARPGSSSLDLDPLGIPRAVFDLGCLPLPSPDWDGDVESGRASPERRPTSEYVFHRSKVISVPEDGSLLEAGEGWKRFLPPLPSPQMLRRPPRAF